MEKTETKKLKIKEMIRKVIEKFLIFLIAIIIGIFFLLVIALAYGSLV